MLITSNAYSKGLLINLALLTLISLMKTKEITKTHIFIRNTSKGISKNSLHILNERILEFRL